MPLFGSEKSLSDIEQETEVAKSKRELLEEKVAIRQLEERLGKGGWRLFSNNGKRSGFSLSKAKQWLTDHFG